jgi:hypothetical protein
MMSQYYILRDQHKNNTRLNIREKLRISTKIKFAISASSWPIDTP